jgi:hypothetical protein
VQALGKLPNSGVHPEFIAFSYPAHHVNDPLRVAASMKGGRYIACNSIDKLRALGVT